MNDAVNYVDLFGLTSNDICYTVQPGDCVWKIADKYDCTTQQVIDNNNFSNPNLIHPGDKIYIPVAKPAAASDTGSTISAGSPAGGGAVSGGGTGNASMGGGAVSSFISTGISSLANGFGMATNFDFGFDYSQNAAAQFENGNYLQAAAYEVGATAELVLDLGATYYGVGVLGGVIEGAKTAIVTGSLMQGYIQAERQINQFTEQYKAGIANTWNTVTAPLVNRWNFAKEWFNNKLNQNAGQNIYTATIGGGGSTNTINTNGKTVTFGHGGRHLEGTNLSVSEVEKQIAKDISKKNLSPGSQQSQKISINGIGIEYRPYVKEDGTINIGTYFTVGE